MTPSIPYALCFVPSLLFFGASSLQTSDKKVIASTICSENRRAVESIHTFHCRFTSFAQRANEPSELRQTGEYWRAGEAARMKWSADGGISECVVSGGRKTAIWRSDNGPSARMAGSVQAFRGMISTGCEPFYHSLLWQLDPRDGKIGFYVFDEMMTVTRRKQIHAEAGTDKALIELVSSDGKGKTQYWFDPKVNFLLKEIRSGGQDPTTQPSTVKRVERFKEAAPGVFFPERVVHETFSNGNLAETKVFEFTEIAVNRPMPRDTFQIRFTNGTEVNDSILGKKYRVDEIGKQVGPAEELGTPSPPSLTKMWTETRETPKSWTQWILPASMSCLAVSIAVLCARTWRARRE